MIFYFSGTGNTRWVATSLAEACGEPLTDIATLPPGEYSYALSDGERLGFCFPIHGWQPPRIVRQFVSRLIISNASGHYCFALCTCGDNVGEAMGMLRSCLLRRGVVLDSAFSVTMPDTYVCLPTMDVDSPGEKQSKLQAATGMVARVAACVRERHKGLFQVEKGALPMVLTYVIGAYFNRRMITDRPFVVDAGRCLHCGRCVDACPTHNMQTTEAGTPQWLHTGQCTCCLACYHLCPVHAINYGRGTRHKGQYYYGV